jgi:hypothetical protein
LGLENEDQMIWSKGIEAYGYKENKVETVLIGGLKHTEDSIKMSIKLYSF